jgi:hypothetical protein
LRENGVLHREGTHLRVEHVDVGTCIEKVPQYIDAAKEGGGTERCCQVGGGTAHTIDIQKAIPAVPDLLDLLTSGVFTRAHSQQLGRVQQSSR